MSDAYTPGPWRAEHRPSLMWHVYGSDHAAVCFTPATVYAKSRARRAADARLIAAAPCLLEALIEVVAIADRKTDAFDRARAAIAKATASAQQDGANHKDKP